MSITVTVLHTEYRRFFIDRVAIWAAEGLSRGVSSIFRLGRIRASSIALPNRSEYVGGILDIEDNELVNIDGLSSLQRVDGNLHIKGNLNLSDLDGLSSLRYAGEVDLEALVITDLDGLNALTTVGGSFTLDNLFFLQNVEGLSNLTSIEGSLHITKCRSLPNLDGLDMLETVGRIRIVRNDKLPTCEVESLADRLISNGFSGDIAICENAEDACGSETCD
jgi:hypothetical protein